MDFYPELARRTLALANALQYENAACLLVLALSASDDPAPARLMDADTSFTFYRNAIAKGSPSVLAEQEHTYLEEACKHVEAYLEPLDG